ncbi:uncharacterized protein LOC133464806 [Cololabis saira]|uniref:uncharacterized protein LOC133464806 n=1 Tax=Cololabis saira TaxID=129043 RepID=UPI002AD2AA47|nr:uncharacterized protein LOC133464806 [Cololabis saira]
MAGRALVVMRLLLLPLFQSGLDGEVSLMFPGGTYDISFPCGKNACYEAWYFSARDRGETIAVIRNGELRVSKPEAGNSRCTLQKDQMGEDVGHQRCPDSSAPDIILRPGEAVALQCVLLSYVKTSQCRTTQRKQITLAWVEEANDHIQEDSQPQINQRSLCDITLTLIPRRPANKTFSCLVTVGGQQARVDFWIKVLGQSMVGLHHSSLMCS